MLTLRRRVHDKTLLKAGGGGRIAMRYFFTQSSIMIYGIVGTDLALPPPKKRAMGRGGVISERLVDA